MSAENGDSRPQKRLREEEDTAPVQASASSNSKLNNLARHEDFWFDDGSVVLVARNTGFRVFRSLLTAQSTVFSDMLSSSSPSTEEMYEGCPVVHLSDSPQDVAYFLGVLLPKSQRTLYARSPRFSFRRVSAIIRLAHKYLVQDVLDQAITALEQYFTSDFNTWEHDDGVAVVFKPRHAVAVVNLARLVDRPSMLPIALYECALLGGAVFKGYRREDKSIEHLDQSDIVRCIEGRNKLAAKAVALISDVFIMEPCMRCERRGRCKGALKTMLEDAIGSDDASDPDVLNGWKNAIKDWAKELRLCGPCEKAALDRDTAARKRVWKELPSIFGIEVEGWNSSNDSDDSGSAGGGDEAATTA